MVRKANVQYNGGNTTVEMDQYPDRCGICHKNVDPIFVGGRFINNDLYGKKLECAFQCTNIECNSLIIGYYSREKAPGRLQLEKTAPILNEYKVFNDEISEVSHNFVEIYNQSYTAEQKELHLISGIGYRKALEFLIKDFLIYLTPEDETEIIKMPLNQCIKKLDNHNIKEVAKRAAWIGNDEAHYIRKWEDKDVNDLKKLIDVTLYYISMEVASKKYLQEMI